MTSSRKSQRTPCEVYSRVTGYLRPVNQWNDAKQAEFANRRTFVVREDQLKTNTNCIRSQSDHE